MSRYPLDFSKPPVTCMRDIRETCFIFIQILNQTQRFKSKLNKDKYQFKLEN